MSSPCPPNISSESLWTYRPILYRKGHQVLQALHLLHHFSIFICGSLRRSRDTIQTTPHLQASHWLRSSRSTEICLLCCSKDASLQMTKADLPHRAWKFYSRIHNIFSSSPHCLPNIPHCLQHHINCSWPALSTLYDYSACSSASLFLSCNAKSLLEKKTYYDKVLKRFNDWQENSEMVGKESRNGCLKKSALPEPSRACEKDSFLSPQGWNLGSVRTGRDTAQWWHEGHCCTRLGDVAGGVLIWKWFVRRCLNQEHLAMILRNYWGNC